MREFRDNFDDFRGARFERVDLSGARFHDVNLAGATISGANLEGVSISGMIGGLVVNYVEVEPLVEAELDRRHPERAKLRPTDPAGMVEAWSVVESLWSPTVQRAKSLPEPLLHERVDGEWSFVETLRHLIFATDAWIGRVVFRDPHPFHPLGVAHDTIAFELPDTSVLGFEDGADPSLDEVLVVRDERLTRVRAYIAELTPAELERVCEPTEALGYPSNTEHRVLDCLQGILEEEWYHHLFAVRDLAALESR